MDTEQDRKMKQAVTGRKAEAVLAFVAFTESIISPILVDPFLLTMTLAKPSKWKRFALIASVASIVGGLGGYILGALFFEIVGQKVIAFYSLHDPFEKTVASFNGSAFWFTLIGAFTPVPYKLVTIVGGFLKINIWLFLLASIIGRGLRFYLVGLITNHFGERALRAFSFRFSVLTSAVVVGITLYILFLLL